MSLGAVMFAFFGGFAYEKGADLGDGSCFPPVHFFIIDGVADSLPLLDLSIVWFRDTPLQGMQALRQSQTRIERGLSTL